MPIVSLFVTLLIKAKYPEIGGEGRKERVFKRT